MTSAKMMNWEIELWERQRFVLEGLIGKRITDFAWERFVESTNWQLKVENGWEKWKSATKEKPLVTYEKTFSVSTGEQNEAVVQLRYYDGNFKEEIIKL